MSTMKRLFILTAFALNSTHTLAQDNAACDAACNVPCYFGECAPAKASYDDALRRCDVSRLELVGQLYGGTASGDKAREAASILRGRGYGTSRITATPNTPSGGAADCTALLGGDAVDPVTVTNPCTLVNVPAGFRCEVVAGRAELIQQALVQPEAATQQTPGAIGPRPSGGQAATHYDGCIGGDMRECFNLGWSYDSGERGVAQDYARAVALYRQACEGGEANSCSNLGTMYDTGLGVAQDYARAFALFRQACEGGEAAGCSYLGDRYRLGLGVLKDLTLARQILTQGCNGGDQWGCDGLKEME